jgi:hypothetical protein
MVTVSNVRMSTISTSLTTGSTSERNNIFTNNPDVGSIFYNTDTSNVEIRHEDPSNSAAWRDLVVNNREEIDISGNLTLPRQPKLTNQPCFLAYNEKNYGGGVGISLGANSAFPFKHTSINEGSCFTTSTSGPFFEAPVNGIYRFTIKLSLVHHSHLTNVRYAGPKIKTNGNGNWNYIMYGNHSFSEVLLLRVIPRTTSSLTWIQSLNSGDQIQVQTGQGTGMWIGDEIMFMGELAFAQ